MLIRSAPSACVIPASTPGRSGTCTTQPLQLAGLLVRISEHAPAVVRGFADPAREEAGVAGRERLLHLLDATAMLGERRRQRFGVVEEDVDPDPGIRAGDASHVAQRPARRGERLVPVHAHRAGLVQQHVRERVREVTRQRDEPVVRLRIHRHRHGAERRHEAVQRCDSAPDPSSCRA